MTAMILAGLLALPQDESVARWVKQFLAGEGDAGEKIKAIGAPAIRPMIAERAKYSGDDLQRLDRFIFEAKQASDSVGHHESLYKKLRDVFRKVEIEDTGLQAVIDYLTMQGIEPIVIDPFTADKLAKTRVSIKLDEPPFWRIVDAAARGAGGEWAVRYGVILISTSERLWGTAEPKRLEEKELRELEGLLPNLGSESLDERDKAVSRILELGAGAGAPIARAMESGTDPEIVARAKEILRELSIRNAAGAVLDDRCGIDFQRDQAKLLDRLHEDRQYVAITDRPVDEILTWVLCLKANQIDVLTCEPAKRMRISVHFREMPLYAILALVTKPYGLDFCMKDGKIWVDTAENIRKFVRGR